MAIYYEAAVSPEDITAYTREVPIDAGRALIALFGAFETSDTNTIDFAEILHTNRAARYRTFDGRVHVSERDTGSEKRVPMLPFSNSLNKGEYERLQLEFARTAGTNVQALVTAIYNDADQLTNEMLNRIEIAIGDLLTDGKLTMNLPGEPGGEADYGVPGNQLVTVAVPWDNLTTATPLSDLLSLFDAYVANGNAEGGSMMTSRKRIRQLLRNKEIINQVKGAAAQAGRVNLAELNGIFDDEGLPTLRPALDESLDVDGVTTRVLDDDRVVFLPPNPEDLLKVKMGVSATALELVSSNKAEFTFEDAPGIVGIVEKADGIPYRELAAVDAVGMPYLKNARRLAVLEVA